MEQDVIVSVEKLIESSQAEFWHVPGTNMTCCVLVLESGFNVLGKVDQPTPDPETAKKLAFSDAADELARLETYRYATAGPRIQIAAPSSILTK
ncbi:MAG: hypothetical protein V4607_02085 [Pseudomonadota bacterium]